MGYRTVVVLYNDQAYEWMGDSSLGQKIATGMNDLHNPNKIQTKADLHYGRVVECVHADQHTLAFLEGYRFNPIVRTYGKFNSDYEEMKIDMLRAWADRAGYRLVKKPEEKK